MSIQRSKETVYNIFIGIAFIGLIISLFYAVFSTSKSANSPDSYRISPNQRCEEIASDTSHEDYRVLVKLCVEKNHVNF